MEENRLWALIKFGKREFIEKFRKGEIYMNHIDYFRQWENFERDGLRPDEHPVYDPKESVFIDGSKGRFEVEIKGKMVPFAAKNLKAWRDYNALCMFGLYDFEPGKPFIDPKNCQFGDCFTIVLNVEEFIKRMGDTLIPQFGESKLCKIEYAENWISSEQIIKAPSFLYQKEYRFIVPNHPEKMAYTLNVGSLIDLTSPIIDIKYVPHVFTDGKGMIEIPGFMGMD